jgi:hypothetical protein
MKMRFGTSSEPSWSGEKRVGMGVDMSGSSVKRRNGGGAQVLFRPFVVVVGLQPMVVAWGNSVTPPKTVASRVLDLEDLDPEELQGTR